MSCCGQKRQGLNFNRPQRNTMIHEEEQAAEQPQKADAASVQFRYTGNGVLEINGFLNMRRYRFSSQTPVLSVSHNDVSTVRGYDDLVEIR
jgi:hypothetical protein